jgi:hypothetical protein
MRDTNDKSLYLIWKDPRSRRNYTVGRLSKGDSYAFEYCGEYEDAMEAGWECLKAFPEVKRYVNPSLFAAFASRLPDPRRRDIDSILRKYGLDDFDGYELLRRSTGRLPIDTYEFIDPILPEDQTVTREFNVVGIRHNAGCQGSDCDQLPTIGLGDEVVLRLEPENEHDEFAVMVLTQRGEMLGYVPRYYSEGVSDRLACGMTYACTVIGVDHAHGCESCLKVRLVMGHRLPVEFVR